MQEDLQHSLHSDRVEVRQETDGANRGSLPALWGNLPHHDHNEMSTEPQPEEILESRPPTPEEEEESKWVRDLERRGYFLSTDSLRQMVTLTSALLAGSAGFFHQLPMPLLCKTASLFLLLGALIVALFGVRPRRAIVDLRCAEEVKAELRRGDNIRTCMFNASAILLVLAFASTVLGILLCAL
jgi:hypothetical protein